MKADVWFHEGGYMGVACVVGARVELKEGWLVIKSDGPYPEQQKLQGQTAVQGGAAPGVAELPYTFMVVPANQVAGVVG